MTSFLLSCRDSNPERQNQNLLCYHYTTAQTIARKRLQRYTNFLTFQNYAINYFTIFVENNLTYETISIFSSPLCGLFSER